MITYADKIKDVMQKLIYTQPNQYDTHCKPATYFLQLTREEISVLYSSCWYMLRFVDPNAEIEPYVHITISNKDRKSDERNFFRDN